MSRRWQNFEAPGPPAQALPIAASPWHRGRIVRLPLEHWQIVNAFASARDEAMAQALERICAAPSSQVDDAISVDPDNLGRLIDFLAELAATVAGAAPLVPAATEEVPDELPNHDHARMLEAVRAVLIESKRMGAPFQAWID